MLLIPGSLLYPLQSLFRIRQDFYKNAMIRYFVSTKMNLVAQTVHDSIQWITCVYSFTFYPSEKDLFTVH